MSDATVYSRFADPGVEYRSAPFWAWNDSLSTEELKWQLRSMKARGLGGFFMHSRDGLETTYMGPEWMACIRETVREAKKVGMRAWLYDEDRWASGAAAGKVAGLREQYQAKGLVMKVLRESDVLPADVKVVAVYRADFDDDKLRTYERVGSIDELGDCRERAGIVFHRVIGRVRPWYNYQPYADILNPRAVAKFIELTHEEYRKIIGREFGKVVPGIFLDETSISQAPGMPWTDDFPRFFKKRRGYDLLDYLPDFNLTTEHSPKIRHDFWLTATELFVSSFSKQLGDWCERNGLALTGHYHEWISDLYSQIYNSGATMPHYVHQQIPGIDSQGICCGETLTPRGCTSVAHQFGRKWALSETYSSSGWEITFDDQKWSGDWQYVQGINIRCLHLSSYSLRGGRKRDWPQSFNYQTPWWRSIHVMEDYFARLGAVLSEGEPIREVLLIHPISSLWCIFEPENEKRIQRLSWEFRSIAEGLMANHYDYDLADEMIMRDHGQITGSEIRIKRAGYKLVVIPPVTNLLRSTARLLIEFLSVGGSVIAIGSEPERIDGERSDMAREIYAHSSCKRIADKNGLRDALAELLPRRVSVRHATVDIGPEGTDHLVSPGGEAPSILYMERRLKQGSVFFFSNMDRKNAYDVTIELKTDGRLQEWDAFSGKVRDVEGVQFNAHFGPAGSKLFVAGENLAVLSEAAHTEEILEDQAPEGAEVFAFIGPMTRFKRTSPNVLTLDSCEYRLFDDPWSDPMPLWCAQKVIRERLDMVPVWFTANDLPQRYAWCTKPHPKDGSRAEFRFSFLVRDIPKDQVFLVSENAKEFTIMLNGVQISNESAEWYLDKAFHKVPLPALVTGKNEIVCQCGYRNSYEIEDCYVIGDFGVDPFGRLIGEPSKLRFGDWTLQGYRHYPGSIIYEETISIPHEDQSAFYLQLGDYAAVTVSILVNGTLAGHLPFRSRNIINITEYLHTGDNLIGIEVMGSPVNMLGPLHRKEGREPHGRTHPMSFRTTGAGWTDEYMIHPWGLLGQVRIYRYVQARC